MPIDAASHLHRTARQVRDTQNRAVSSKSERIPALDFTKGALVLFMVLYHWLNYFVGDWPYYDYLRFLTPSFIFITGFIISNVYLSKYDPADPHLWKRLVTRGCKLMAMFLFLNLARSIVAPLLGTGVLVRNPLGSWDLLTVFASGNFPLSGSKLVAFYILVPISYVLISCGILMLPYRRCKYTFHLVCLCLLSSIIVLKLAGTQSYNLELVTIGIIGVLIGFTQITTINKLIRHSYLLASAYVCYMVAITKWRVPFPVLIVGVALTLLVLYALGDACHGYRVISEKVRMLGKYSLFGYITQIAILQIISVAVRNVNVGIVSLAMSLCAAVVITTESVEVVHRTRTNRASVDRLYKAVFA